MSSMLSLRLARHTRPSWLRRQSIIFLLASLMAVAALHYPTAVLGGALVFWSPTLMCRLLPRLQHWWLAGLAAIGFLLSWVPVGKAQGLFGPAQKAMQCVVSSAGSGDTAGMLTKLPFIIFTGINIVILGYFIYVVVEAISSYGRGETVSHVVQVPIVTFIFLIFLFLFSNFLFSGATC